MIEPVSNSDMRYPAPNLSYVNRIKMNNIKRGMTNLHVQIVREALSRVYPAIVPAKPPIYDDQMAAAVRQYQYDIGSVVTGDLTRDEVVNLSEGNDFTVV